MFEHSNEQKDNCQITARYYILNSIYPGGMLRKIKSESGMLNVDLINNITYIIYIMYYI